MEEVCLVLMRAAGHSYVIVGVEKNEILSIGRLPSLRRNTFKVRRIRSLCEFMRVKDIAVCETILEYSIIWRVEVPQHDHASPPQEPTPETNAKLHGCWGHSLAIPCNIQSPLVCIGAVGLTKLVEREVRLSDVVRPKPGYTCSTCRRRRDRVDSARLFGFG